ncbi:hypothetical protein [Kitasatospora acidiphila]|uniref:hypothetical protein n=1 Tax=Kitasatospora acidiphila TaxID=2567942 RepID=UPI0015F11127|nr:hypothetical protein [Kitasatospora acidiphila]
MAGLPVAGAEAGIDAAADGAVDDAPLPPVLVSSGPQAVSVSAVAASRAAAAA